MATGKVVWFNEEKGYGFIEDKKGNRYFAHFSEIQSESDFKRLSVDQTVNFEPGTIESGLSVQPAKNIEIQK